MFLLAALGSAIQAEVIIRTHVEPAGGPYTAVSSDNRIESQNVNTVYRTSQLKMRHANANRIIIPFMRFDISAVTGLDLSGAVLSHTITWESNSTTVTLDVYGLIDGENDYWDSNTLTWTLASGTLAWLTWTTDGSGIYTNYTPNAEIWQKLGTVTVSVTAGSPNLTVATNPTDCNLDSFLNADTNGLVTLALMSGVNNHWCDIASADISGPGLTFPESYRPTLTIPVGQSNPQPANNSTIVDYDSLNQLCFENKSIPLYQVWFGAADANELDYRSVLTRIASIEDPASNVCVPIPAEMLPLSAPQTYTWVVDGYNYPISDPNQTGEPNQLAISKLWKFFTSSVPTVHASPADQYKFPGETAVFSAVFDAVTPVTEVFWYRDNTVLNPSDPDVTIEIINGTEDQYTAMLTLANIGLVDEGSYFCVAYNSGGSSSPTGSAYLVVKRQLAGWNLDADASDSIGNYNGTLYGNPTLVSEGNRQAMVFDGVNDYIQLPPGFANFNAGMTISVWAKPSVAGSWARFIDFGNFTQGGAQIDNILFTRYGVDPTVRFDSGGGAVNAANVMALNEWQHFGITMTQTGAVTIYKNGLSIQTGTVARPAVVERNYNYIGKSNWTADALYSGAMDEIKIYNYALSADDMATLYSDVAGPFCRTPQKYDFNGNCVVDLGDLEMFAAKWLDCGYWPAVCPPLP